VSDRPPTDDSEREEPDDVRPLRKSEGVRIIGAEEAAAAIEAGQAAGRRPDDAPRFGDVPPPPPGPRPPLRFPMPGADPSSVQKPPIAEPPPTTTPPGAGDLYQTEPYRAERFEPEAFEPEPFEPAGWESDDEPPVITPARGVDLPHWTEPGSGEMPRILGDAEAPPEEDLAWSSFSSGPRWRDQPSDWEEPDFADAAELGDDDTRLGALDTARPDYPDYSFDEPEPLAVSSAPSPPMVPVEPTRGEHVHREGPPRDVRVALGAGLALGVVVLLAAKIGAAAMMVVVTAILVVATAELFNALRMRGYHPATLLGLAGTASMMGAVYWRGEDAIPLVLGLFVVFAFLWYLAGVVHARPTMNIAVSVLAFLYVGFLGSFAALLLQVPVRKDGVTLLLLPIVGTVAYDVGAFFVGSRVGRTPLAPNFSPNKTWEGLVGATVATFVVLEIVVGIGWGHPWTAGRAFWLAAVISVAAPLGDLCESMIKRDLGVKDMGSLIPGHGGVLDRIDALLFVVPAAYYLLRVLKFA
jgi:phosphatidate cytidylyltransferase